MKNGIRRMFAAKKQSQVLELFVYSTIGEDWFGFGITPQSITDAIAAAKKDGGFDSITVHLNSPGGDSFDGVAIHNILRQQKVPVNVIVEGLAASAAFTIAMAGDKIQVCDGAMMMLHNAWTIAVGDSAALRKSADLLDQVSGTLRDVYSKRSGISAEDVKALMDAETWLAPQECVEKGFADEVMSTTPEKSQEAQSMAKQFNLAKMFNHVPDRFKASKDGEECQCPCEPCQDGNCDDCEHEPCDCVGCDCDNRAAWAAAKKGEKETKRVGGKDCTKGCFAYRPDDNKENWKLPIESPDGDKAWEEDHIRNAISRWSSTDMPDAEEKSKARGRIKAAAKEHDIEVGEDSLKDLGKGISNKVDPDKDGDDDSEIVNSLKACARSCTSFADALDTASSDYTPFALQAVVDDSADHIAKVNDAVAKAKKELAEGENEDTKNFAARVRIREHEAQ